MLKITIPASEQFDAENGVFITTKEQTIQLEHSLVSIQKWESKWRKPFLSQTQKTVEEITDYIRCMTLTQNVDPNVYTAITPAILRQVYDYIDAPMTATTFSKNNKNGSNREIATAEIIYYQMIALGIPFECRKWHLNQLLTLIRVCAIRSQPPKKMSNRDTILQNRALNEARKRKHRTRG